MPRFRIGPWVLLLLFVLSCGGVLQAEPLAKADETAMLIEHLTSEDTPTQDSAIQSLENRELDDSAIPLLMTAAESDNLKGQHAAFKLLVKLAKPQNELGKSARAALKELSKSKKPQVVAAATQAMRALLPAADPAAQPGLNFGVGGRGGVMIQNVETVMMSTINGERQIQVANQKQKIQIKDREGKEIEIKVTEIAGGKETTYTAKDVEELKQKHADVLPLYEKYTRPRPGLPAGMGGLVPGQPQALNIRIAAGGNPGEANKQIENSLGRLAKVKKALEAMDKETFDKEQVKGLLDELDAAKKELFAAQAQLGMP
jgi:hypothetical protein